MISIGDFKKYVIGKISKVLEIKVKETHHVYYHLFYNGKLVLRPYHSHRSGSADLYDYEEQSLKNQLRLDNKKQLYDLKNCPLSAESYLEILRTKKVI